MYALAALEYGSTRRTNGDSLLIQGFHTFQKKMLLRRDENMVVDDAEMKQLFEGHLQNITAWLSEQSHLKVIEVWYNDMLKQPAAEAKRLNAFFGGSLAEATMASVVDESLYRNRSN